MTSAKSTPPKPPWLAPFLAFCHTRTYEKHTEILRPGESAETLYYLIEGSASVALEDEDRRELLLAFLHKGEFIGEMGLFCPQNERSVVIRTRTRCQLAEIGYKRLDALLDNELKEFSKELLYAIGRQVAGRLRQTSRKAGHLAYVDVTGRIAATLLDLCKHPDAVLHPDGIQIRITRQDIGRIVGCSREMAGRVFKSLEEQGLIRSKGKTVLVIGAGQPGNDH